MNSLSIANLTPQINSNQLSSFRKAVSTNNKQSLEKHLSQIKQISEIELNNAIFTCIDNFRLEEQSQQCLFLLLRYKANPNIQINGQTPLIAACKIAQLSMVKQLLENGAKADLCNQEGRHPLQFILKSRKQNYDVAEYLISAMISVNIEIDKSHPIIISVENQFVRIFKILVEKGANLTFSDETILHIIIKKKFKDVMRKKKFLKELCNRPHLATQRDKNGKLPIEYQTEDDIKTLYADIFKPKIKPNSILEKQKQIAKTKEKQFILKEVSRQKSGKKKSKQQEASICLQQQGLDDEQAEDITFTHEEDKDKIFQVIEEEQEQKKGEEEKNTKKTMGVNKEINNKSVALNINKKNNKSTIIKIPKQFDKIEKTKQIQKDKIKKIADKKKKQIMQITNKKNKSFTTLKKEEQEQLKKKIPQKQKIKQDDLRKQKALSHTSSQQGLKILTRQASKSQSIMQNIRSQQETAEKQEEKKSQNLSHNQSLISQSINLQQSSMEDEDDDVQQQTISVDQQLTIQIEELMNIHNETYYLNNTVLQSIILFLNNKMQICLQSHIQRPFEFKILVYGSQLTGLAVEHSDLDLLICTNLGIAQVMDTLENHHELQEICEAKFLKNASVPIIKLQMSGIFKMFKVDLTFQMRQHTGLRSSQLISQFMHAEPLLRPLVITLKNIIYTYDLSDPYTGGLGSYSLTLMVIALLQFTQIEKKTENIGKLLLQFLYFYGFRLEYVCQAIILLPPGFSIKPVYSIYQLPNTMDLTPKLVIYDPLNPVNNVGRATYRIQCLKKLFKMIYIRLVRKDATINQLLLGQFMQLVQQTN